MQQSTAKLFATGGSQPCACRGNSASRAPASSSVRQRRKPGRRRPVHAIAGELALVMPLREQLGPVPQDFLSNTSRASEGDTFEDSKE